MNKSEQINELAAALAKAQADMKPAHMSKVNPHFRSKYAPLNEVIEVTKALAKQGLAFVQPARVDADGSVVIETMLLHSSGQWLSESLALKPQQNTAQGVGAAITYGRRFGLSSLIGIAADEDDDGEEASKPAKPNGNGATATTRSVAVPTTNTAQPPPEEQLFIKLTEALPEAFVSQRDKEAWQELHREEAHKMPMHLQKALREDFSKVPVRS